MKELSALFLAIIAIVFIHASNKSEAKSPVDKKKNNGQSSDRREIQDKAPGYPVAAFASLTTPGAQKDGFNPKFSLLNPPAKKEKQPLSVGNGKGYMATTDGLLMKNPTYLFYYQRIKFSKDIASAAK